MPRLHNIAKVPARFVDDPRFASAMRTLHLGAAAGSEKLYVNVDHVKPGKKSARYHSHSKQEEFFLILGGEGTLRLDGKTVRVKKGDFVAKPAGQGLAHQFVNDGTEVLEILDVGLNKADDICTYPDEGVVYVRPLKQAFKKGRALTKWSSDPN